MSRSVPPNAAGSMPVDPSLERTFRGHKSYVTSVAFSPSLKQLASSAGDNCIMMWNFKPQLRAFRYIGHKVSMSKYLIWRACCHACRAFFRTSSLMSSSLPEEMSWLHLPKIALCDCGFPLRKFYLSIINSILFIQCVRSKGESSTLKGHTGAVRSVGFSNDSRNLITASDDKLVKVEW